MGQKNILQGWFDRPHGMVPMRLHNRYGHCANSVRSVFIYVLLLLLFFLFHDKLLLIIIFIIREKYCY
jgi:hypothetical protein